MDTAQCRALFEQCDSNGDGLICLDDLLTVFGGSEGGFSDDDLKEVMLQLDSGGRVRSRASAGRTANAGARARARGGGHSSQLSF